MVDDTEGADELGDGGYLDSYELVDDEFGINVALTVADGAPRGESVSVTAAGDMTIHGVSNQVSFALEAQLIEGVVAAVGSTDIAFADYGVEVPNGGPVVSVDDFGILEFQFLLTQSAVSG